MRASIGFGTGDLQGCSPEVSDRISLRPEPCREDCGGHDYVVDGFSILIKNINMAGIKKMVNTVDTASPPSTTLPSPR